MSLIVDIRSLGTFVWYATHNWTVFMNKGASIIFYTFILCEIIRPIDSVALFWMHNVLLS